jgi:hypothetical protein
MAKKKSKSVPKCKKKYTSGQVTEKGITDIYNFYLPPVSGKSIFAFTPPCPPFDLSGAFSHRCLYVQFFKWQFL